MRRMLLLPALLLTLACTAPQQGGTPAEPDGGASDPAPGRPCEPEDPCTGMNCGVFPTGCPGATISCACDPDLRCEEGKCEPGLLVEEAPEPGPGPRNRAGCQADAQHCCLPDGTIVKPGGCQPSYPRGVRPATVRGADGSCQKIPCHKRCLPAAARILAAAGEVRVDRLAVGDEIFTLDRQGRRVLAPLLRVEASPLTAGHTLLELRLADGRRVRASPAHPAADGRLLAEHHPGGLLDGAEVIAVRELSYAGEATWDLLPAGGTGLYWADGVLLGSTLGAP